MTKKKMQFEEALEKLEKIVSGLENGDLALDKCLEEFEQGLEIYKDCKDILQKAEKRITVLSESLKEEDL